MLRISMGYGKYHIFEAEEGGTAIEIARREKPDVVLLDVMMPGQYDGFQVCKMIKQDPELANCFIVLITARSDDVAYAEGRASGADAYLVKPFRLARLIEVVEKREVVSSPVLAFST
jgi:CheY-like chemotaxis protein